MDAASMSAPSPWPTYGPPPKSGMRQAAEVLLLVGSILHAASALFILIAAVVLATVREAFMAAGGPYSASVIVVLYVLVAIVSGAGAAVGFTAYGAAKRGDLAGGFVRGLVASLLPPVQVVLLVGAILCKTCPEASQPPAWPRPA